MARTRTNPSSLGQLLQEVHVLLLGLAGVALVLLRLLTWWQRLTATR